MKRTLALDSRIIFRVTALMTTLLVPMARAQVRSLTLGIDTNCPNGLTE
jgi:hypothetical protein